jgi:predicted dehydrogenase
MLAPGGISDQPFFQIQGSLGEIVIDGFEGGARLYTVEEGKTVVKEFCHQGWDAGYRLEYADFIAAVVGPCGKRKKWSQMMCVRQPRATHRLHLLPLN